MVLVVPGTGRRYNGPREAVPRTEETDTTPPHATGGTRPVALPQDRDRNELVDGEMIYLDGEGSVGSITICSNTERTGIVLSDQEEPHLEQPSETDTDGYKRPSTGRGKSSTYKEDPAKTMGGNMKRVGRKHH